MHIHNQVVRLFKPASLQLFAVLLVGTFFQTTLPAQEPGLTNTASIELSPSIVGGKPALVGSYQLTCSIQDDQTKYGFGEMKLFYSITVGNLDGKGDVEVQGLSGLYADGGLSNSARSGSLEVTGPLGGSRVRARLSGAFCHHDQLNSELITVWSQDIVIPPQISVVSAFDRDNRNAPPYVSMMKPIQITDVPNVPAGKRLVIVLDINAHPQGTEAVVLHYEGAGVLFEQVLYDVAKEYNPMTEVVTPTDVGDTFKVWAEIRPTQTKSNFLQFHVVADPDEPKAVSEPDKPNAVGDPDKPKTKKTKPRKLRIGAQK